MPATSRDRISVDLRGLKAALIARSRERGVSPSDFVRRALEAALDPDGATTSAASRQSDRPSGRVRLSLRMPRSDSVAVLHAARQSGLAGGDFVAMLVRRAAALGSASPAAQLTALTASCAELATLSRNLHHLTTLLREGSSRAAQEYREMLDNVNADVRAHLALATSIVVELRPLIRSPRRGDSVAAE